MNDGVPTISDVIRGERNRLEAALERDGMERAKTVGGEPATLEDVRAGRMPPGPKYYGWLGGFDRFGEIASVTNDWWWREPGWSGSSWCCTPQTPVYVQTLRLDR